MAFDALAQVVRVGDRAWPVVLDCSRNTAWVDLGGRRWKVRALGWGQKRNLARFTALGPRFLRRQLVVACTGHPDVPADPDEAEALAAVGAWLSAPTSGELPLDPVTLADVTAEWVRRTGRAAAEVDAQPAADVEAWWQSRAETRQERAAPAAPEPSTGPRERAPSGPGSGLRRIVVVPEAATPARGAGPALDGAAAGPPRVVAGDTSAGEEQAGVTFDLADRDGMADAAASRPAVLGEPEPRTWPSVTTARPATTGPRDLGGRPVAPRFRMVYPAAAPPIPMTPGPAIDGQVRPPSGHAAADDAHVPADDLGAPWPVGGYRAWSPDITTAAAAPTTPVVSTRRVDPADSPAGRVHHAPARAPRDDTDAVLDALADRLADAASAAGIDVSA
jgi:hypothetical protein